MSLYDYHYLKNYYQHEDSADLNTKLVFSTSDVERKMLMREIERREAEENARNTRTV